MGASTLATVSLVIAIIALAIAAGSTFRAKGLANRLSSNERGLRSLRELVERLETRLERSVSAASASKGSPPAKGVEEYTMGRIRQVSEVPDLPYTRASQPPPEIAQIPSTAEASVVSISDEASIDRPTPTKPSVQYSVEAVRELYADWCRTRTRPKGSPTIEIASLQYDGQSDGADGRRKHLLKDASQLAEFVRFSARDDPSGVVLPDPDAHFTPVVAYLFPGIARTDYAQTDRLCSQEPVAIRRCSLTQWEAM